MDSPPQCFSRRIPRFDVIVGGGGRSGGLPFVGPIHTRMTSAPVLPKPRTLTLLAPFPPILSLFPQKGPTCLKMVENHVLITSPVQSTGLCLFSGTNTVSLGIFFCYR